MCNYITNMKCLFILHNLIVCALYEHVFIMRLKIIIIIDHPCLMHSKQNIGQTARLLDVYFHGYNSIIIIYFCCCNRYIIFNDSSVLHTNDYKSFTSRCSKLYRVSLYSETVSWSPRCIYLKGQYY